MSDPNRTIEYYDHEIDESDSAQIIVDEDEGDISFIEFTHPISSGVNLRLRSVDDLMQIGSTIMWALSTGIDQGWVDLTKEELEAWVI